MIYDVTKSIIRVLFGPHVHVVHVPRQAGCVLLNSDQINVVGECTASRRLPGSHFLVTIWIESDLFVYISPRLITPGAGKTLKRFVRIYEKSYLLFQSTESDF